MNYARPPRSLTKTIKTTPRKTAPVTAPFYMPGHLGTVVYDDDEFDVIAARRGLGLEWMLREIAPPQWGTYRW